MCAAKYSVPQSRPHDYLYDSVYIVSGARDYARSAFKAAMGSAQLMIQPVFKTMFSDLKTYPRNYKIYHTNCRLPDHLDRSYRGYLARVERAKIVPQPVTDGKDNFKFYAHPKPLLHVKTTSPDFHPPSPVLSNRPGVPVTRGTQSVYRESSAQTVPWQPDGRAAKGVATTPEVLYLDALKWGPGDPYRTGDLPADFHTTEIINKMRHARVWTEFVDKAEFPRWMKKRDTIIQDIETRDWIFREAEIDELQDIRLSLLHKLQFEQRNNKTRRTCLKLARRWDMKKKEMEEKVQLIRRTRDREIRKLTALHAGGGRLGLVQRMRASRGMGSIENSVFDPTSDMYAPVARHGYQAQHRNAEITYDPSLLLLEDHAVLSEMPPWLNECGQNLKKTCSGHALPRNEMVLCERETKWSEKFLRMLHEDLMKARLGAAQITAGPLHVLKPRRLVETPRPATPEVESVSELDEQYHQAALMIQKIIRGRAVQCLMYEGRTRAAELTEELKTTHGLQREDKIRIALEEAKARDYSALRTDTEQREDAITALVDELCGGAVSAALDFLEKELRRLKEERRQHAFILIALREKQMREAAEAGRRQKEEQRRREHDEMFKQVLGVTQETVNAYLEEIITEGIEHEAEKAGVIRAQNKADEIDEQNKKEPQSIYETNELVAELVQQFLLPNAHKTAARMRIEQKQQIKLNAARRAIFDLFDSAEIKPPSICIRCGNALDDLCRCLRCNVTMPPVATTARDDPRWKATRVRPRPPEKTPGERIPPPVEFRCMLNTLVDEAVDYATGAQIRPVRKYQAHHYMVHIRPDALERTEPARQAPCPKILPSEIRQRLAEAEAAKLPAKVCVCETGTLIFDPNNEVQMEMMLPSELRSWQEKRKCKCDMESETQQEADMDYGDAMMEEQEPWDIGSFDDIDPNTPGVPPPSDVDTNTTT